jgi:hypothetical protein
MSYILGYLILSIFATIALCAFFKGAKLPPSSFGEDASMPINGEYFNHNGE